MTDLDEFSRAIADVLRILATEQGQSQISLSQRSGVSQAQISRVFSHKRSVSIEDLSLIAEALGTTASHVVREAESRLESEVSASAPDGVEGSSPSLAVVEGGGDAALEPPMPDFSQLAARTVTSRPEWDAANATSEEG